MCLVYHVVWGVSALHGFVLLHLPNTKEGVIKISNLPYKYWCFAVRGVTIHEEHSLCYKLYSYYYIDTSSPMQQAFHIYLFIQLFVISLIMTLFLILHIILF